MKRKYCTLLLIVSLGVTTAYSQSEALENGRSAQELPEKTSVNYVDSTLLTRQSTAKVQRSDSEVKRSSAMPVTTGPLDQVTNDNMIIKGSLAVGIDAVNGEDFGNNTIVLKEDNPRIKFDDTSASEGFSDNDWVLLANESGQGGANCFAIEDATALTQPFKVMGGAPQNALFVSETGRLGMGTADPLKKIHTVNGDTPTLRLQQDNSIGWGEFTWDVAGNEANFFIRDVVNSNQLPFRIFPAAPTNTLTLKKGTTGGSVGIGTNAPNCRLDVTGIIKVSDEAELETAQEGMIRYKENHFWGYNGSEWLCLADITENDEEIAALNTQIDALNARIDELVQIINDMDVPTPIAQPVDQPQAGIEQNYPNPFDGSTRIKYNVSGYSEDAAIVIYDLSGKQLKKYKVFGSGVITISAGELYEGLFIYSLLVDGQVIDSKRMTISQ